MPDASITFIKHSCKEIATDLSHRNWQAIFLTQLTPNIKNKLNSIRQNYTANSMRLKRLLLGRLCTTEKNSQRNYSNELLNLMCQLTTNLHKESSLAKSLRLIASHLNDILQKKQLYFIQLYTRGSLTNPCKQSIIHERTTESTRVALK